MSLPSPRSPSFSLSSYRQRQGEISLHMSHFFLGYLKEIHRLFEGDLALVIVLGEIAHHSTSRHFSKAGNQAGSIPELKAADPELAGTPSCSAFSLAAATGLPRETVRRKIARLVELGWVARTGRAEVRLTPKVGEVFVPEFNMSLLDQLLKTAEQLREILNAGSLPPESPSP